MALPASKSLAEEKTEQLDGNFVLTISINDKQQIGKEVSIVVATPIFQTASSQPTMTFNGVVRQQENGVFLVDYQLGIQMPVTTEMAAPANSQRTFTSVQYQNISTKSTVLLHLGVPIQIIKDGERVYTLKLDRYDATAKAPAVPAPANVP